MEALSRGGVKDTRLEAKAKDTKKILGQGQPYRGQTHSRPRTGMLNAKAKDQEHNAKVISQKVKKVFAPKINNFSENSGVLQEKNAFRIFSQVLWHSSRCNKIGHDLGILFSTSQK